MTGLRKGPTGNCGKSLNLTIWTSGIYNLESILQNETQKLLWAFEIQTDQLISARRPNLVIVKKKKKEKEPAGRPQSKIKRKW